LENPKCYEDMNDPVRADYSKAMKA